jgi:hypothetical protein
MKTAILALLLILPTIGAAQDDLLTRTLKGFGLDSSTVGYREQPGWLGADRRDPFRLPFFDDLLKRPLRIPNYTRQMLARFDLWMLGDSTLFPRPALAQVRPLAGLVMSAGRALGCDLGRYGFDYTPAVAADDPLGTELQRVYDDAGQSPGATIMYPLPTQDWTNMLVRLRRQTAAFPPEFVRTVATLLGAVREAVRWRNAALARIPHAQWEHIYRSTTLEESQCDAHTFDQTVYDAAAALDLNTAHYGAMLLAQAVEKAVQDLRPFTGRDFALDVPTPLGRIVISGSDRDTHYADDSALLIDLGGDDTYLGPTAASSPTLPVSICIDLRGDDTYRCAHEGMPAQGAGILGYGMLLDLDGNDTYDARTFSQGCGRFGVGVLYDAGGRDTYTSLGFSQGAGLYGSGILFDRAGDDSYRTVYYAQGYGFSRGLGLLADAAGSDSYTADDTNLIHVGDETPKHNESDAQGYGAGRRADHLDGHNMSGGIGVLNDLGGDDHYSAGVFAQGSGYWYGMGVLRDRLGDDTYRGVFFNLGASAHWAIGLVMDEQGNDASDLVMTLGFGTAHDCSAAFYLDLGGDDRYSMSAADSNACSLGSALNNAFGLFANIGGKDSYAPVGRAFGFAPSARTGEWGLYAPSVGLFFDIDGDDRYPSGTKAQNNSTWINQDGAKNSGVYGSGTDADAGGIRFERE